MRLLCAVITLIFSAQLAAAADDLRIEVHADRPIGNVSRYMTGACLEDVNHEVYGGIDSQMIFGESFQEPPASIAPRNFTAYGGEWAVALGELSAAAGEGPKLLLNGTKFAAGEASVGILFADKVAGNAGFILKVNQPGVGADRFTGYEVSLDTSSRPAFWAGIARIGSRFAMSLAPCRRTNGSISRSASRRRRSKPASMAAAC